MLASHSKKFVKLFVWESSVMAVPCGLWDLNSLTRDQTCGPCSGNPES